MKILLLNTSDRTGGAAVAANRLLHALLKVNVTAYMLVRDKTHNNDSIIATNTSYWIKKINFVRFIGERLLIFICNRLSKKNLFQVSLANTGEDITKLDCFKKVDVIHLHWINQGFLSLKDIQKIVASEKTIVWTLHDLWPATSICHYPGDCSKYQKQCTSCPQLYRPWWNLALHVFQQKQTIDWSKVCFVGCSQWITRMAQTSSLLKQAHFYSIPNPIDTTIFHPQEKIFARQTLQLPLDKPLLLFAAAKVSDKRKGAHYLIEACQFLKATTSMEIVLMGGKENELKQYLPFPVHSLGYLSREEQITLAYSCADLFVIPSLEDNLPNTIMEAMACGTPCVGFRTGGIPEMIDHKRNGYVADYKDAEDLARGIRWVLDYPDKARLSEACVEKVQREYAEEVVAKRYIDLYNELVK